MKKLATLAIIIVMGCSRDVEDQTSPDPAPVVTPVGQPKTSTSCSAIEQQGGVEISCPDGTSAFVKSGADGAPGADGKTCSVVTSSGVSTVVCPDGTRSSVSDGRDGADGAPGQDGSSGVSQVITLTSAGSACPAGGVIMFSARDLNNNGMLDAADDRLQSASICNGVAGADGAKGEVGEAGADGADGYDQVVAMAPAPLCVEGGVTLLMARDLNRNAQLDFAEDDRHQSATVCNGLTGAKGEEGDPGMAEPPSAFSPVAIVDPCGDDTSALDEIMLRLGNGQLLASVSDKANGQNTRLSMVTPGSYKTTDGTNCSFTVHADLSVTW